MKKSNCIIIGSGPAGYTAAIYAARSSLKPIVFSGIEKGGQLTTTTLVENFPGFPKGIDGPELMDRFESQAKEFGTEIIEEDIKKINICDDNEHILVSDSHEIKSKTVIISTGASAKYLGMESEKKFLGYGVSACATCDGFFHKGKDVVIVGGGDTAAEEALFLSKICNKIHMLIRKDTMRASQIMQSRLMKTKNIKIYFNSELDDILGDKEVEYVKIIDNQTKQKEEIKVSGVFIAIGHKPNTDIFKGQIDMDESGYIKTNNKSTQTNIKGIFACGDVQDNKYRQAITAAGSGCMAAMEAEKYIRSLK